MALPLFPVYLASNGFVPPEKGTYYLVAKDGIYMRVERLHGSSLVKVKEIPFLDAAERQVTFDLPKISGLVMAQAKTFFKSVFEKHRSESYLTLYYSKKLEQYRLWCPKQTVSYASVNYDRTDGVPVEERNYLGNDGDGWQMVGTIHSHCDFSAFHSGTDEADEATFDGVHLTFGHVPRDRFSIASSLCFNNNRTKVDPSFVASGITEPVSEEVEQEYETKVHGVTVKKSYKRTEYWFELHLTKQEQEQLDDFNAKVLPTWLDKVSAYVPPQASLGSWVPSDDKTRRWVSDHRQGELFGNKDVRSDSWDYSDSWRYSRRSDNEWGIREWDGD